MIPELVLFDCDGVVVHAAFDRHLPTVPGVVGVLDELDRAGVATCVASIAAGHATALAARALTATEHPEVTQLVRVAPG